MDSLNIYNILEINNIIHDYKEDLESIEEKYNKQMKWLEENNKKWIPLHYYFKLIDDEGDEIDMIDLIEDEFEDYDLTYENFLDSVKDLDFVYHEYYEGEWVLTFSYTDEDNECELIRVSLF